jgi:hypothetical protein
MALIKKPCPEETGIFSENDSKTYSVGEGENC